MTMQLETQKRTLDLGQTRRALPAHTRQIALQPYEKAISTSYLSYGIAALDFCALLLAGTGQAPLVLLLPFCVVGLAYLLNAYHLPVFKDLKAQAFKLGGILLLSFSFFSLVAGQLLVTWFALSALFLLISRLVLKSKIKAWLLSGALKQRLIIVGGGATAGKLIQELFYNHDVEILGFFDDRVTRSEPNIYGVPNLGNLDDLLEFTRLTRVDTAIIALPLTAEERVLATLDKLWVLPIALRMASNTDVYNAYDKPLSDMDRLFKAVLDMSVGALALVLLSPIMALVALAIRLESPGKVLFKQRRYGFNNKLIEVYKFRSMYANQSDIKAIKQATKDDPRITRVGKFIRKTSLDELPQLFNVVFKRNLSLVGPRPHPVSLHRFEEVTQGYFARHKVKPGMTGWAQVNGWRGETDTDEKMIKRVAHDLHYVENWSLWLDIKIIALTPYSLVKETQGAY